MPRDIDMKGHYMNSKDWGCFLWERNDESAGGSSIAFSLGKVEEVVPQSTEALRQAGVSGASGRQSEGPERVKE